MEAKDKLADLNLTADELDRMKKALKDKKFFEMLRNYAEEISDPENKKRYEEEIKLLEEERGNKVEFIHPEPFRALRTSVNGEQKCFINICGSDKVGRPEGKWGTSEAGRRGQCWSLPHSLHPGRENTDTKGRKVMIYDVVFHPDTLHIASKNKRFMEMVDHTAIEGIQNTFKVALDQNNTREMKIKYKGTPQPCVLRTPIPGHKPKEASEKPDPLAFPYPDEKRRTDSAGDSRPKSFQIQPQKTKEPTKPKYTIKYRSFIDLQDFRCSRDSAQSPRPKEIVVTVDLPLLKTATDANLEVKDRLLLLESKKAAYRLELPLAYPVDEDGGEAKFNKQKGQMIITLPVLPSEEALEFVQGLHGGGVSGEKKQEEEMEVGTTSQREEKEKEGERSEQGQQKGEAEEKVKDEHDSEDETEGKLKTDQKSLQKKQQKKTECRNYQGIMKNKGEVEENHLEIQQNKGEDEENQQETQQNNKGEDEENYQEIKKNKGKDEENHLEIQQNKGEDEESQQEMQQNKGKDEENYQEIMKNKGKDEENHLEIQQNKSEDEESQQEMQQNKGKDDENQHETQQNKGKDDKNQQETQQNKGEDEENYQEIMKNKGEDEENHLKIQQNKGEDEESQLEKQQHKSEDEEKQKATQQNKGEDEESQQETQQNKGKYEENQQETQQKNCEDEETVWKMQQLQDEIWENQQKDLQCSSSLEDNLQKTPVTEHEDIENQQEIRQNKDSDMENLQITQQCKRKDQKIQQHKNKYAENLKEIHHYKSKEEEGHQELLQPTSEDVENKLKMQQPIRGNVKNQQKMTRYEEEENHQEMMQHEEEQRGKLLTTHHEGNDRGKMKIMEPRKNENETKQQKIQQLCNEEEELFQNIQQHVDGDEEKREEIQKHTSKDEGKLQEILKHKMEDESLEKKQHVRVNTTETECYSDVEIKDSAVKSTQAPQHEENSDDFSPGTETHAVSAPFGHLSGKRAILELQLGTQTSEIPEKAVIKTGINLKVETGSAVTQHGRGDEESQPTVPLMPVNSKRVRHNYISQNPTESQRMPVTDGGRGGSENGLFGSSQGPSSGSERQEEEEVMDEDDLPTEEIFPKPEPEDIKPQPALLREIDEDGNETVIRDHSTSAGFIFENTLMFELD